MSSAATVAQSDSQVAAPARRRRRGRAQASLLARGEPVVWLNSGALVVLLLMIVLLLLLVLWQGARTFWPVPVVHLRTLDGKVYAGEITRVEEYRPAPAVLSELPAEHKQEILRRIEERRGKARRRLVRTGNFELTNTHFHWVDDFMLAGETKPAWSLVVERVEWGRFYGAPKEIRLDGKAIATDPAEVWSLFQLHHPAVRQRWHHRRQLETNDVGQVNRQLEAARLALRGVELGKGKQSPEYHEAQKRFRTVETEAKSEFERIREQITTIQKENDRYQLLLATATGQEKLLAIGDIVRAYPANQLTPWGKLQVYASRWWEFLSDDPREANSEGGVLPAIWGTVAMTLIMSLAVVPFGVLAALYLREYAKAGPMVSAVRIAVNNLAGVPSIVFGVFGLGFFCYIIGASIDELFFVEKLPNPTYGTGGLLWASLTLALLTLPVVIVATEEALAAVPSSMREGSYACGASKWQTIHRIVLPRAMPGILTGTILAMARGAGEVAPLMLVGAVKLAPKLPLDSVFPYLHPERTFMHLGFHIYDLGFQSQNSEAAKPMVYTTTLLLIFIVAVLNLTSLWLRTRLRKRFVASQF